MNVEGMPKSVESTESQKQLSYQEAVKRYLELKDAVPEAEKLAFNEHPPRNAEERIIAKLDLQIEACKGQAEAYAQSGDPFSERMFRMVGQFKEAEKTILSLYFDALEESPEFAEILSSEHPWIGGRLEEEKKEELIEYDQAA